MDNKIDQLKTEVKEIKNSLNELKNNVTLSEEERKKKAEALKNQAEATRQKIKAEIDTLADKTDDESKKQKEEADTLLNSFNEIMNLYNSILNNSNNSNNSNTGIETTAVTTTPATAETATATVGEEKGFFGKAGDWIGEQWSDVTSGDKWKEQPGSNILRAVGFGVTGYAAYKGVKALWNWAFGDKEEGDETDEDGDTESKSKKKKKKSFWETGFGKTIKYSAIGSTVVGVGYWLGKKFGWWGGDKPTDSDRDQVKAEAYDKFTEKPENKEAVENYEAFGENVDIMYNSIYKKELLAGYQDELSMDRISEAWLGGNKHYLGIVPFCLDNKFGTVESIMEQNTSIKNALAGGINEMVGYIKGLGNEFLKTFADSYLSTLPGWAGAIGSSLSQKFDNWIASNQDAKLELQFFFRQSIRAQTYLFEKKDQLIDKIATEKASGLGMTKKELLEDDEKFEEYIEKDGQYSAFMGSSIANASNVLKNKGIFDASIGNDVKDAVDKLDKERKDVVGEDIGGKDILQIVNEKEGKNLSADEKGRLGKACENIVKDVDNKIKDAVKASAWNSYGDLFTSDDSALREYREKSGLEEVFQKYKTDIIKNKAAMDRGELNEEQINALAESVNNMLALKKEAILGRNCIQKDRDEHGNIIYRVPGFLWDSFKNLGTSMGKLLSLDFMGALNYFTSGYLGAGGILYIMASGVASSKNPIIKLVGIGAKKGLELPIRAPLWVVNRITKNTNRGVRMNNSIKYGTSSWIKYRNLFNEASGPVDLLDVFKSGERNLSQTTNILKAKLRTTRGDKFRTRSSAFGGIELDDIKDEKYLREKVFDKLLDDYFKTDLEGLRNIKNDSELYETLLNQYDNSPAVRKAIKSGRIDKVRTAVNNLHNELEEVVDIADTAARRAFNSSIDRAIGKFDEFADKRAFQETIDKLDLLKKDATLADEEMEAFVKLIDNGFHPKFIPELKKLFSITEKVGGKELGSTLKQCLDNGQYGVFKSYLTDDKAFGKIINTAGVNKTMRREIVSNFDKAFKKLGSLTSEVTRLSIKNAMKIIFKAI